MAKIDTYQKILNSATALFARHGYDGAIMDDLASQCEVNKASIYYHHKDKATLYENVLTALFIPVADTVTQAVEAELDVVKKMQLHITSFAKATMKNPEFAAILMREMAAGGNNMPVAARKQMQRILKVLHETLSLGQSQGIFKTADVLIIHFMILGTINLFIASIPFRESLPKTAEFSLLKNTQIESASQQLVETIIGALLSEEKI
jgi:AcrR family transcriptional regulator